MLSCEVIKDLLPLYYDGVCTPDSFALVHEHLQKCEKCRNYLSKITQAEQISNSLLIDIRIVRKVAHLQSLKQSLNRKLVLSAIAGFMLAFSVCVVLITYCFC